MLGLAWDLPSVEFLVDGDSDDGKVNIAQPFKCRGPQEVHPATTVEADQEILVPPQIAFHRYESTQIPSETMMAQTTNIRMTSFLGVTDFRISYESIRHR